MRKRERREERDREGESDSDRKREIERERKKNRKRDSGERGRHDFILMHGHTGRYKGRHSVYVEYSISEKMASKYHFVYYRL